MQINPSNIILIMAKILENVNAQYMTFNISKKLSLTYLQADKITAADCHPFLEF